jgi:hypothetical protein
MTYTSRRRPRRVSEGRVHHELPVDLRLTRDRLQRPHRIAQLVIRRRRTHTGWTLAPTIHIFLYFKNLMLKIVVGFNN